MTFISYAQNFEDVMLYRALKHIDEGFYVDVGANDPIINSVSYAFYKRGWRGINIEPMNSYFERLCGTRPLDINLPTAVAEADGELVLYNIPNTGLSTIEEEIAQKQAEAGWPVEERKVPVTTLNQILQDHANDPIHFLKIDVEGAEKTVLQGLDLTRWRPWILVIEATVPMSQELNFDTWESMVIEAEYENVYFDGLNRFYVAKEHIHLAESFELPPNIFDDFFPHSDEYLSTRHEQLLIKHDRTRSELDRVNEELRSIRSELDRVRKERDNIRTDLEGIREDRNAIRSELNKMREELSNVRSELKGVRKDRDAIFSELKLVRNERDLIRSKLDEVREDRDVTHAKLGEAKADQHQVLAKLNKARTERDQIRKQLDEVWADRHRLWTELDNIYHSLYWKLFSPFRKLYRKIRFWRNRVSRIMQRPFSQNISKVLRRIEKMLRRTSWGKSLLDKMESGNPRLWYRVVTWIKRSDPPDSIQKSFIKNISSKEEFSENEKHFLSLFQRELVKRQNTNKENK